MTRWTDTFAPTLDDVAEGCETTVETVGLTDPRAFWARMGELMSYTPPTPKAAPDPPGDAAEPLAGTLCFNCGLRDTTYRTGGTVGNGLTCSQCGHLPHRPGRLGSSYVPVDFVKLLGLKLCQTYQLPDLAPISFERASAEPSTSDTPVGERFERAPLVDGVSDAHLAELGAVTFYEYQRSRGVNPHTEECEANQRPWQHLPPWDELRIACYRRWPSERFWRSPSRFEEARQLAGGG